MWVFLVHKLIINLQHLHVINKLCCHPQALPCTKEMHILYPTCIIFSNGSSFCDRVSTEFRGVGQRAFIQRAHKPISIQCNVLRLYVLKAALFQAVTVMSLQGQGPDII